MSGLFLLIIAAINIVVLFAIASTWRRAVRNGAYNDCTLDEYLANRGLLARVLRPLLRVVNDSWMMYPIGFLFGLGFDTASEVALLGIAALTGASGMPIGLILLLPLLFVAGMSLVDTTDGVAMLGAYGWAFLKPIRKPNYDVTITAISVAVALFIGGLELLGVIGSELHVSGRFWDALQGLSFANFDIMGLFIASWFASVIIYRARRIDDLDVVSTVRAESEERSASLTFRDI